MTDAIISMFLKQKIEAAAAALPVSNSIEYVIEDYAHLRVNSVANISAPDSWAYGVLQITTGVMAGACFVINNANLDGVSLHFPIDPAFGIVPGDKFILRPGPIKNIAVYLLDPATIEDDYKAGKRCFMVIDRLGGDVATRSLDNSGKSLSFQDVEFSFDVAVDCVKPPIPDVASATEAGYNSTISSIAAGQIVALLSHIIYGYARDSVTPYIVSSEGFSYNYSLKAREGLKAVLECVDISFDLVTK